MDNGPKDIPHPLGANQRLFHPDNRPTLTPQESAMRKFFRGTFRSSQGHIGLQEDITNWAIVRSKVPIMDIPRHAPFYILDLLPPTQHKESNDERIKVERANAWARLHLGIQNRDRIDEEALLPNILSETLKRELKFQIMGRPQRTTEDIFESYLRKNTILGEPASSPEMTDLATELKGPLEELRAEPFEKLIPEEIKSATDFLSKLYPSTNPINEDIIGTFLASWRDRKVLAFVEFLWERNHPGQSFFPEPAA